MITTLKSTVYGADKLLAELAEEETETVTPQPLKTVAGNNTISATAEVSGIEVDIQYMGENND